jgi:hypothetical protein
MELHMAVTTQNPAPYAPASAILDLIDRYRNRGLSRPFNAEVLGRAGVSDSLIPRTLQALQALELIGEDGNPTDTMEALQRAPEPEFKKQMAAWISSVYADVLSFVNASDDETAIRDAFRHYNPMGQQTRMVSLFMGLCRAAGMRTDDQSNASARPRARKTASLTAGSLMRRNSNPAAKGSRTIMPSGIPSPIAGLLTKLPPEHGEWTKAEREKFESAFKALLDFCFTVSEKPKQENGDD